jgi:hypothetical protein
MPLAGCQPVIVYGGLVAADAGAGFIVIAEVGLGGGIALVGSQAVPGERFIQVLGDTNALFVEFPEPQLCGRIALFGSLAVPVRGQPGIDFHPVARQITVAECDLGACVFRHSAIALTLACCICGGRDFVATITCSRWVRAGQFCRCLR